MDINANLQNLYKAQQQKTAYTDYNNKTKKKETPDEQLFKSADVNGDGKIDKNDLNAVNKQISNLTASSNAANLLDVTGDKKITLQDVLNFDTNVDIDGDGKVSEEEKAFLEEQQNNLIKNLKAQKDTVEYDVNGDGKVNFNDGAAFLQLTEKVDFRNQKGAAADYLKSFQNTLNSTVYNFCDSKSINLEDLAVAEQRLKIAQDVVNNDESLKYLSQAYINHSDFNKDGKVDAKDVSVLQNAVKSLQQQLGVSSNSFDNVKDNWETKTLTVTNLTNDQTSAKSTLDTAKKATSNANTTLANAKKATTTAKTALDNAKKATTTAKTALDNAKKAVTTAKTADQKADAAVKTAQTAYDNAVKALNAKKAELSKLQKTASKAEINKLKADVSKLQKTADEKLKALNTAKAAAKKTQTAYDTKVKAQTTAQNNYNAKVKAQTTAQNTYDAKVKAQTTAQNNYNAKVKAQTTAQTNYDNITKKLSTAKTEQKTAQINYDKVKSYYTKKSDIEKYVGKEMLTSYSNAVYTAQKAYDTAKSNLTKAENAVKTAQTAANKANKTLNDAKTKLANLEKQAKTAKGSTLTKLNSQIKTLKSQITTYEKTAKTKTDALTKAKTTAATAKTAVTNKANELSKAKNIQATYETTDKNLLAALNGLTEQEKLLIKEQNIDITETFADGTPKYFLAKGVKDGKWHLYEFETADAKVANTLIRQSMGYNNKSFAIIGNGNGRLELKTGTNTNEKLEIIVPTKSQKTITETVKEIVQEEVTEIVQEEVKKTVTVTEQKEVTEIVTEQIEKEVEVEVIVPADKEVEEVMDELVVFYNDLLQENHQAAKKPDMDVLKEIQKEVVTAYYNDKLPKADIAKTIANKLTEKGFEGNRILSALGNGSARGEKINNLINKLTTTLDSTKDTTETYKHTVIETVEKEVTKLVDVEVEKEITEIVDKEITKIVEKEVEKEVTKTVDVLGSEKKNSKYTTYSPLSFDLNGDGVKTSETKIKFDIDGDGVVDTINDSADAVLVFDADGDGISGENGKELFGDNTDLDGDGVKDGFANGFEALKALARKEGMIGENDNSLSADDLAKLQEKYGLAMKMGYNGQAQSLTDLGITSINLGTTTETQTIKNFDGNGNELMTQEGATFDVNGQTQVYGDIWHVKYDTAD